MNIWGVSQYNTANNSRTAVYHKDLEEDKIKTEKMMSLSIKIWKSEHRRSMFILSNIFYVIWINFLQ